MTKEVTKVKSKKLKKWMKKHFMPNSSTFIFRNKKKKKEWAEEHVNLLMSPKYRYK